MSKVIDLNKTVFDLSREYPEIAEIMAGLGFTEIRKKPVLHSVGKMMTIPKGAKMKDIPLENVLQALKKQGFEIAGGEAEQAGKAAPTKTGGPSAGLNEKKKSSSSGNETAPAAAKTAPSERRKELLKSYLQRLGKGEDPETVKADFIDHFKDVEASEIMKAEQELLAEGTPLSEVQRLCDVHSALFHGATREEKIANAEKAVEESLAKETAAEEKGGLPSGILPASDADYTDKDLKAKALAAVKGHPLYTFTKENEVLAERISRFREAFAEQRTVLDDLKKIRELAVHYAKKGDLLYPLLKVKYQISGPSDVMWTVDDEIRDEIADLVKYPAQDEGWKSRAEAVIGRADEMIYKEQNILFPICAVNFTEEEWKGIYQDSKDYSVCLDTDFEIWEDAEERKAAPASCNGEIAMPGGCMTAAQLTALLNTIPVEITFVDADNINRFFNEGPKVFKRPGMAIGRDVFSCHPPKIEPMVRTIIDDFRNDRRDYVPVWMDKGGKCFLVTYMAVRDKDRNYLGTAEIVQDMEFAKKHFLGEASEE